MRIGVDLGGTKVEALALDENGVELGRIRVSTPKGDYAATVATIAHLVGQLEERTGRQGSVGVGIPGTIVAATGLVKNANSTWLNGRPLEQDLSVALGRAVRCANDANCFAVSEATDGAARGLGVVFGVILGTGCGGGLSLAGRVHAGPNGIAGEWGHTPLPWPEPDELPGPACYCGRQGCLETWISGTGFEAAFARSTGRHVAGPEIVAMAHSGDADAQREMHRLIDRLARGLAVLSDVLDPDAFVLGGGLSRVEDLYRGELAERTGSYVFGGNGHPVILRNLHGDSSGVRGAAWLWPPI